jgi:hypothetical protein
MPVPTDLRRGARVTARYLNALREAARRALNPAPGTGLSARETPGGIVINRDPEPEQRENCVRALYRMSEAERQFFSGPAPRGGVVRLIDALEAEGGPALAECGAPEVPGLGRVGVLQQYAEDESVVWVQTRGPTVVLYDSRGGIARKGDRLANLYRDGAATATGQQYLPVKCGLGPLHVVEDRGSAQAEGYGEDGAYAARYALVEVVGDRGDAVMVQMTPGDVRPFHTLYFRRRLWGSPVEPSENYPGVLFISPSLG